MIRLNSQFVADATRSYVERDPRNMVGAVMVDELAAALIGYNENGKITEFALDWPNSTAQNRA